ncbi:MAG: hypothetical protein AAF598_15130 [Bacteroidota bacterium]
MSRYKSIFVKTQEAPKANKWTLPQSVDGDQLALDVQMAIEEHEILGYRLVSTESIIASVPKSGTYFRTSIGVLLVFEKPKARI